MLMVADKYQTVNVFDKHPLTQNERFWLTFVQAYVRAVMIYEKHHGLIDEYNRLFGGDTDGSDTRGNI